MTTISIFRLGLAEYRFDQVKIFISNELKMNNISWDVCGQQPNTLIT